jgi:hypothetical protein
VFDDDPVVATGVAELLADMAGALEPHRKRLRTLLDHWTDRGTWCERDAMKVNGGHCPKCNQVPPSPRACLVELLGDLGELSNEELLSLEGDPRTDVAEKARNVLVRRVHEHAVNLAHELRADSNPAVRTCGVRQLRALRLQ